MRTARFDAMGCAIAVGGATASRAAGDRRSLPPARQRLQPLPRGQRAERGQRRRGLGGRRLAALCARDRRGARRRAATGGLVDPTPGRWNDVRLLGRLVLVPAGVRLDLDRVARAAAVDDALELLAGDGFVSAGGDVAARGDVAVAVPGGGRFASAGAASRRVAATRPGSPWVQVTAGGGDLPRRRSRRPRLRSSSARKGPPGSTSAASRGASSARTATCSRTGPGTRGSRRAA